MRAFRNFIATLLILIIIGGLGYVGYSYYYMGGMSGMGGMNDTNTSQANQQPSNNVQTPAQGAAEHSPVAPNTIAAANREILTEAIGLINQAIDLMTIDPYSKATVPDQNKGSMQMEDMPGMNGQSSQGTGAINIYPNGNSSVNITPAENAAPTPNNQTPQINNNAGSMSGMGNMTGMTGMDNMQQGQNNYVFDQNKLTQLHNGIFTLAQGIMSINQLNDDLFVQSTMTEANPANYQTYVIRYNTALQNKNNLSSAINMLSQASTLINVNPYASQDGYAYDIGAMNQLHQGVYKLAQGMALLNKLNQEFGNQMINAGIQIQGLNNVSNHTAVNPGTMADQGNLFGQGIFTNMSFTTLFNIILIVLLISLIIGVLGAIANMLSPRNKRNKQAVSKIQTESDVD
jgi:flagellar basal body-associated protein FliL